jgi:predicted esterase
MFSTGFIPGSDCKYKVTKNNDTNYIFMEPVQEKHKYSLIFLHGLGDSAMGFYDVFDDPENEYNLVPPSCKIILPTAPVRPVTLNEGMDMTSWFDVYTMRSNLSHIDEMYEKYCQTQMAESM